MTTMLPLRLLVSVTFHHDAKRLKYLFQVVRNLMGFPIEHVEVVVETNVDDEASLDRIRTLCQPLLDDAAWRGPDSRWLTIECNSRLEDPWFLPWCHKHLITDRFLAAGSTFTHFINIEDDLLVSFENLQYFVRYADLLRPHGLIPAFQRIEFNQAQGQLRLVDQHGVADLGARTALPIDDVSFVNPDYPHQAILMLDRPMAEEYVKSRSFDRNRSVEVRPGWGLCERASMGLCFESPPPGHTTRYVIPVDMKTRRTPSWSWIYHLPNNYTENPRVRFGKTRPDQQFADDPGVVDWRPETKVENLVWNLKRLPKLMLHGKRKTGHALVPANSCALCGKSPSGILQCGHSSCPSGARYGKAAMQ